MVMTNRGRVVALVSGGPDSAVLLQHLSGRFSRVFPVYVRAGLKWETVELAALKRFLAAARIPRVAPLKVMYLPAADVYGAHWSLSGLHVPGRHSPNRAVYLPGRNLLLISKAAVLCPGLDAGTIAIGTLRGNPFGDGRRCFRYAMSKAVSFALEKTIRVVAPFARNDKPELLKRGRALPLGLTFSCISPAGRLHCGHCNKCAERRAAFRAAGLTDPTRYAG
jgi:7-cyano-7-deazaguanine synthase